jgi:hydrogenase large subunit
MNDASGNISGGSTIMPNNGRIIQNIIHGCDTVMSHITHLYHLSALDFINTTNYPGMAPWVPSYTASDMLVSSGANTSSTANSLVLNYVTALSMRRKMHTASALFSGRHPIQNAIVPGGVTTLFSSTYPLTTVSTDYDQFGPFNATDTRQRFKSLLNDVRVFINTKYIPDVVTVANAYSVYWNTGAGCHRLLAYGDYPTDASGTLFLKRQLVNTLTPATFSQADIKEYVDYSYYQYGTLDPVNLHPFDGRTEPIIKSGAYSWLKAPRLMSGTTAQVCEVGPLARMVATHASGASQQTVSQLHGGIVSTNNALAYASLSDVYNASQLITTALTLVTSSTLETGTNLLDNLYSPLGRHACRALEAKYVADALALWVDQLTPNNSCYTYMRIPKQISTGYGLAEAPRGALGHWVKIEGRKIAKYQCVVPSTWNFSPRLSAATSAHGAVEQALIGVPIGTNATDQIINILRVVHPFDCCIACAVHVVNPEGKELLKFAIDPDGRPTNIKISE